MLLPALLQTQNLFGFIPEEQASEIGEALKVPLADITGMIEFYSILKTTPVGSPHISVCTSPVCAARGGQQLLSELSQKLDEHASLEEVACLGLCDHAPAALVDQTPDWPCFSRKYLSSPPERIKSALFGDTRMITQWCDEDVEHTLELFLECGGFEALQIALSIQPADVIEAVKDSGLRGRGGAGFPTGSKMGKCCAGRRYPQISSLQPG